MNLYDPFNIFHSKKNFVGEPPGSIAYTGHFTDVDIAIEAIFYDDTIISTSRVEDIKGPFDSAKVYWYNVVGLHDVELIKGIGERFQLHHMDLEDIVHVSKWSKIEDQHDYVFAIFKMIYMKAEAIVHEHVSIIKKDNVIITFQETPGDVFDDVRRRLNGKNGRIRTQDADYLLYALMDALVDQYFVIINKISSDFRDIEMKILDNDIDSRDQVYHLRKELMYLINAVMPIKESILYLAKGDTRLMTEVMTPYYGDLMEHINQIADALVAYKEMTVSLHEMQMSNVSNDMNKIMMTLTIFSAIFIPLSFLAGVFGMNFVHMPGMAIPSAFYIFVAVCFVIAAAMLWFFKSKRWY
ncbi:MAG: magnesium/cobalt transporter CorA [Clostridia bacterium]|nr:magnesium/cobalt transporter CorA [Clostridia bacterium]